MALVLDWKKKLGYKKDPFEPVVLQPVKQYLVGIGDLQEKFNLFLIKGERFGAVGGDTGSGKTSFLLWINEELMPKKSHRPHYVDAKKQQLLDALLMDNLSFFTRRFGKAMKRPVSEKYELLLKKLHKRRHVLLIDNAASLSREAFQLLADILRKTETHIIIADTPDKILKLNLGEPLNDKLRIKIPQYNKEQLFEIITRRVESAGSRGIFPFEEKELESLAKKANYNPSRLLSLARERVIELSLKVSSLPAGAPMSQKKGKMFSIQVQKGPRESKQEEFPPEIEEKSRPSQGPSHEDLMAVLEEADSGHEEEIVVENEPRKSKGTKTNYDKVISDIAGDFHRKPKKKTAKKKAKKKR